MPNACTGVSDLRRESQVTCTAFAGVDEVIGGVAGAKGSPESHGNPSLEAVSASQVSHPTALFDCLFAGF